MPIATCLESVGSIGAFMSLEASGLSQEEGNADRPPLVSALN